MKIGELSRQTGIPIDTVRYYERNGILREPRRRPSGYREYATQDVQRLGFVARAKSLGFSLAEIRDLLALSDGTDVAAIRESARDKLRAVDQRIAELDRIRSALSALVEACPGHGAVEDCPILAALAETPSQSSEPVLKPQHSAGSAQ